MMREKARLFQGAAIILDFLLIYFSFFISRYIVSLAEQKPVLLTMDEVNFAWISSLLLVVSLFINHVYDSLRRKNYLTLVVEVLYAHFTVLGPILILYFVFRINGDPLLSIYSFAVSAFFVSIRRTITKRVLIRIRTQGYNWRTVLVVGISARGIRYARTLSEHKGYGVKVLGFLGKDRQETGSLVPGTSLSIIGAFDDLDDILRSRPVDEVAFAAGKMDMSGDEMERAVSICMECGTKVSILPNLFNINPAKMKIDDLGGINLITIDHQNGSALSNIFKRLIDFIASAAALLLLAPALTLLAVIIKLDSPGKVFFRQKRCGLNGREFNMLKFRSMVADAEKRRDKLAGQNEMSGPVFKMSNDPRITRIGRILRKYSLDELPQLINVFKGEMSLVGPRPPIPSEVEKYERWQRRRLSVKPGLTCLWQVSGRNSIGFEDWVKLDLQYIDNWSLKLDLNLLLKTIPVVIKGSGK